MKKCSRCKQEKLESEFHRHENSYDGFQCYCHDCQIEYNRQQARGRGTDRNRQRYRGVDFMEVLLLLKNQQGVCPICGEAVTENDHLDHCHVTGKNRGMLHLNCNHLLGKSKDNPSRLQAAIQYLNKHQPAPEYQI